MKRFVDIEMAEAIKAAKVDGVNISIFDREGRLIWFSPEWGDGVGGMEQMEQILGLRWLEFVHPRDEAAARAWITAGDGAEVRLLCASGNQENAWVVAALVKRQVGLYWLAVGCNRVARPDEVPPEE